MCPDKLGGRHWSEGNRFGIVDLEFMPVFLIDFPFSPRRKKSKGRSDSAIWAE